RPPTTAGHDTPAQLTQEETHPSRGHFTSRHDLADKIEDFVIAYDRTAKPYRWTYEGSPLKAT
ncbi:hypothetical protein V6U90_33570, partial [Micromonospora sp. CPCC 206060]